MFEWADQLEKHHEDVAPLCNLCFIGNTPSTGIEEMRETKKIASASLSSSSSLSLSLLSRHAYYVRPASGMQTNVRHAGSAIAVFTAVFGSISKS